MSLGRCVNHVAGLDRNCLPVLTPNRRGYTAVEHRSRGIPPLAQVPRLLTPPNKNLHFQTTSPPRSPRSIRSRAGVLTHCLRSENSQEINSLTPNYHSTPHKPIHLTDGDAAEGALPFAYVPRFKLIHGFLPRLSHRPIGFEIDRSPPI